MKETTIITTKHNTYAGEIDIEDFSTSSPNKKRINKYKDSNVFFDSLIKKENFKEKYKNMTLDELRELKVISNENGRPSQSLTDKKWQEEFELRKLFITPFKKEVKKMGGLYSKDTGMWNTETKGEYYGTTNYQEYCSFINDILSNIRSGQIDYVYYIYQINDLLKFHNDTLKTRYCDGYWEVWLDV